MDKNLFHFKSRPSVDRHTSSWHPAPRSSLPHLSRDHAPILLTAHASIRAQSHARIFELLLFDCCDHECCSCSLNVDVAPRSNAATKSARCTTVASSVECDASADCCRCACRCAEALQQGFVGCDRRTDCHLNSGVSRASGRNRAKACFACFEFEAVHSSTTATHHNRVV